MSYFVCICCDLCNQAGFVKTTVADRRKGDDKREGGRRYSDGRSSLKFSSASLLDLNTTLSVMAVLEEQMSKHSWAVVNNLHFCPSCYEKHSHDIDCFVVDQFQLAIKILHNYPVN